MKISNECKCVICEIPHYHEIFRKGDLAIAGNGKLFFVCHYDPIHCYYYHITKDGRCYSSQNLDQLSTTIKKCKSNLTAKKWLQEISEGFYR
jgi:hypothetical protein